MNNRYKVSAITGTRAEYGLLRPLLIKLNACELVDFKLIVTGSHLSDKFGNTETEIKKDGFNYCSVQIPIDEDNKMGMAISTGEAIKRFSQLFNDYVPDLIIVLGDRYEIFAAVSAAHLMGIKIAHIAGGDVTEGAVDDALRHCITKMSYLHFPGCEESRHRIVQMGESPNRVFNVGELGVENCLNNVLLSREELSKSLDFSGINNDYVVVTFHPVTMENNTGIRQLEELIQAMDIMNNMYYVITLANADAGGREINEKWIKEEKYHSNWKVFTSLGSLRYLSALNYSKLCLGNSSSGLVEAPALKIPTVNIGDRQKGRTKPESVIDCEPECVSILNAIKIGLSNEGQLKARTSTNPFGRGDSSQKIFDTILNYFDNYECNNKKSFFNINFNEER